MIPVTEQTITAVAALVYNHAYDQDPDSGWVADDPHNAPGHEAPWCEWSAKLRQVLQEHPDVSDEQLLVEASQRVDIHKAGHGWDIIPLDQETYSTITHETDIALLLVRHFLEHPTSYVEIAFLEHDPAYLAYLEAPIG